MHVRQGEDVEQVETAARKERDPACRGEAARLLEVGEYALQVGRDGVPHRTLERPALQRRGCLPHPVLHFDEVLAPRLVARLELQVARDYLIVTGLDPR